MNDLKINTDFITLGQLLKMTNAISSGGMAKWYLDEHIVYVNGEEEQRRGKKVRHDDVIKLPEIVTFKIIEMTNGSSDVY